MKFFKFKKSIFTAILCGILACTFFSLPALANQRVTSSAESGEVPYQSYTYWTGYSTEEKTPVYSKPMYKVKKLVSPKQLGIFDEGKIADLAISSDGKTYLLDSATSKIYILDTDYNLIQTLENLTYNGSSLTFVDAKGIFVDAKSQIYIADTENARVLVLDQNGNVINLLLLPDSELIPTGFKYRPVKIAVDSRGYTYIASDGSYYGAILYSPQMEFLGFYGANTVKADAVTVIKNIWNKLFSNDVKRAADKLSLPFTFTDLVVGNNDFVYTATGKTGDKSIQTGQICRLNPGGKNVLGNESKNFADSVIGSLERVRQVQDVSAIDVDKDDFFYILDTTYGRVFWYDKDCNLLSVFGGSFGDGTQKGTFLLPSGIAVNGTDVLVSDSQANNLTIFEITDYGKLVRDTQKITLSGNFSATLSDWENVLKQDSNSQLAYIGIAKAYYDLGDYDNAIKYSKIGCDRETYAKAFKIIRTEKIEKVFGLILLVIILIIAAIIFAVSYMHKHNKVIIKNQSVKTAFGSLAHPVENFRLIKEKNQGSVLIATIILVLFYVLTVIRDTKSGFAFLVFDSAKYNSVYTLLSTVGIVVLWVISNWLVCTLLGGIGTLKEIYVVTCYCLVPLLISRLCYTVLTNFLIPDEAAFLGIFEAVFILWTAFMLIIGIMRIHDYEFGKFVATTIGSIVAMIIILFLLFLIYLLSQQIWGWVNTLIVEAKYR